MNKILTPDINKLEETFPDIKNINKSKLLMTEEGLYSVSGKVGAKFLSNIIYKNMKTTDITITDATGNNGSDTLMLAKYYKKINSIELDKNNFLILKNNIQVYNFNNINLINGDSMIEIEKNNLSQDVIYIDAPWGGPDYKKHSRLKLYLGKYELSDIYNKFKNKAKLFALKVPYNYDINNFILKTGVNLIKTYIYKNKKKNNRIQFLILIIKN